MENGLSRNDRHIEDGHATRDIDSIEDDLHAVINAKKEFLNAVKMAADLLVKDIDTGNIVASEEAFDELLYPKWRDLAEEHAACKQESGFDTTYPESTYMQAWRIETAKKFRPEHFRGGAVRNPGSFESAGIDFDQIKDVTAGKEGV